jgi:hypothetical protein
MLARKLAQKTRSNILVTQRHEGTKKRREIRQIDARFFLRDQVFAARSNPSSGRAGSAGIA